MSMNNRSFRDVFVINNPALLTSGDSTDLAISQLGIFNYDPRKDRLATGSPTYQLNPIFQLLAGTPPVPTNLLGAVADQSKASKPISGRHIRVWQGRKAEHGHTQIIALGYDGFDTSKTLFAKCEEHKTVFVKLSGGPIDQAFHTEGRGLVRQYSVFSGCCDDCGNDCDTVSADRMADDLVRQINSDPILSLGTATNIPYEPAKNAHPRTNRLIKVAKILGTTPVAPSSTGTEWLLFVCDDGSETALGAVQAQYSNYKIFRHYRKESTSIYKMVIASTLGAPAPYNNSGLPIIVECPTCPSGYTLVESMWVTKIQRQDAGNAAALSAVEAAYGIAGSGQTAFRLIYQFGQSTYIAETINPILAAASGTTDFIQSLGQTRNSCVLTSAQNVPWASGATYNSYNKIFTITLEDTRCGSSRLAELQAQYPDFTIVDNGPGAGTLCVHQYQTSVPSLYAAPGCPPNAPIWIGPDPFNGIHWHGQPFSTGTTAAVGVSFESAYVDLVTNECAYKYWNYDAEPVFIEVSQHQQDYNERPTICAGDWDVTEVQQVKLPIGVGSQVRDEEIYHKGYERKYWDENPIVRQYYDSIVEADPNVHYDMYTLGFEFDYPITWFSEKEIDSYRVEVYFPEGTGGQFQEAINAYVASLGLPITPVALV
jgi:hypothetical protein